MWQIEHQCPQCGAPVTLQETDRLFACPFCRVRLYLASPGMVSYYLPPAESADKELLFVPYWRFKGMVFSCTGEDVHTKIIDLTRVAVPLNYMPYSLGVRPQAVKLRFIAPETRGTFFKPHEPLQNIIGLIENQLCSSLPAPIFYQAFIGETASSIFSPIYLEAAAVYDAILQQPFASITAPGVDGIEQFNQRADLQMKFFPCLCPSCGWNLEGAPESIVLLCSNCQSAWSIYSRGLEKVEFALLPAQKDNAYYVPFWKITAALEGVKLRSYADLMHITSSALVIQKEWEEMDVYFWTPAFKIAPEHFLRLAQRMTLLQPRETGEPVLPRSPLHPVTLQISEAVESLKVVLASCAVPKKDFFPKLAEISMQPQSSTLVYVPFISSGSEFIHPQMHLSINKNTLKWGVNL